MRESSTAVILAVMILSIIAGYTLGVNNPPGTDNNSTINQEKVACEKAGAVWRQFNDLCENRCGLPENVSCGSALVYGCDCVPLSTSGCWHEESRTCFTFDVGVEQ